MIGETMKVYSVNILIALFTDFKEDGFRTLSESEVLEALQSLNAAEHSVQRICSECRADDWQDVIAAQAVNANR
jgi:hypothetical protein